jgi:hypothetical protein
MEVRSMGQSLLFGTIAGILLLPNSGRCDDSAETLNNRTAVGLALGGISGVGLAYRHFFNADSGISVAALPYITEEKALSSFGVEYLRILSESSVRRVYVPLGASVFYAKDKRGSMFGDCSGYSCWPYSGKGSSSATLGIGGGVGIEFRATTGFSIAAELPIVVGFNLLGGFRFSYLLPLPNVLLTYYF